MNNMKLETEITDELLDAIADRVIARLHDVALPDTPEPEDDLTGGAAAELATMPTVEQAMDATVDALKRLGGASKDPKEKKAATDKVKALLAKHVPKGKEARATEVPEAGRAAYIEAAGKLK